jgi:hypothetical protein
MAATIPQQYRDLFQKKAFARLASMCASRALLVPFQFFT